MDVLVQDIIVFLRDLNKSIIKADYSETACFEISSNHNDIYLHEFKTTRTSMVNPAL